MKVGLTGGVGSGKSAVARLLAEHGAAVVDADAIAREVVEPGTPGFDAVVAAFGSQVLDSHGRLDRSALAAIVFADEARRVQLNAIVHPLVGRRSAELMQAAAPAGATVVYDVPLLVESNLADDFDLVVVVEASVPTRLARLAGRGMTERDAQERIAAQASDAQRRAVADEIVDNDGSLLELSQRVDALWKRLSAAGSAR